MYERGAQIKLLLTVRQNVCVCMLVAFFCKNSEAL